MVQPVTSCCAAQAPLQRGRTPRARTGGSVPGNARPLLPPSASIAPTHREPFAGLDAGFRDRWPDRILHRGRILSGHRSRKPASRPAKGSRCVGAIEADGGRSGRALPGTLPPVLALGVRPRWSGACAAQQLVTGCTMSAMHPWRVIFLGYQAGLGQPPYLLLCPVVLLLGALSLRISLGRRRWPLRLVSAPPLTRLPPAGSAFRP